MCSFATKEVLMINPAAKGKAYEEHVVELLQSYGMKAFRTNRKNDTDIKRYGDGFDGGVDIIANFSINLPNKACKDLYFYIQCKDHKNDLTKTAVQEVYTGMHVRKANMDNCIPVVFCSSGAPQEVRQYAYDLGVELFLQEHQKIISDAIHNKKVPYDNYGMFMRTLLYHATKDECWIQTIPNHISTKDTVSRLNQLLTATELDFNAAQSQLDTASLYEQKAREARQKALDISKQAALNVLQATGALKKKTSKMKETSNDLEDG